MIGAPLGGRIADRVRRSTVIVAFGLAQVPCYAIYGLLNGYVVCIMLFGLHGAIYALMQPAVDATLAAGRIPGRDVLPGAQAREPSQVRGEAQAVLMRRRDWYLALAQRAFPELLGPRRQHWLRALGASEARACSTSPPRQAGR